MNWAAETGLVVSLLVASGLAAAENIPPKENVCLYGGVEYSAGAIVVMNGVKRECRDSRHEMTINADNVKKSIGPNAYVSPSLLDSRHDYAWRNPLRPDSAPKKK